MLSQLTAVLGNYKQVLSGVSLSSGYCIPPLTKFLCWQTGY